jgi:hypothetical protein
MHSYAARLGRAWYLQLADLLLVLLLGVLANMYVHRAMHLCCKLEMSDGDTLSVTLSRSTKTMALVTQ